MYSMVGRVGSLVVGVGCAGGCVEIGGFGSVDDVVPEEDGGEDGTLLCGLECLEQEIHVLWFVT